ncbi:MAG: DUF5941 domain-containing protein [Streptosporangiaceae bacterium]
MTVALVLAAEADAGLRVQLAALGVRQVDAAERAGPGLLTVAATARAVAERVLICGGDRAVPEEALARLLGAGETVAFTGENRAARQDAASTPSAGGALVVHPRDLDALAGAAESVAASPPPDMLGASPDMLGALLGELARRGVTVRMLDAGADGEGAVARLLVDPAARNVASWAAGRRLAPGSLYGISLGFGLVAAVWFSELSARAQAAAIVALAASFVARRAGAVLAASRRDGRVRPIVDWLGAAAAMLTEFAVYAGLAASTGLGHPPGAVSPRVAAGLGGVFGGGLAHTAAASWGGAGSAGVWRLAVAAMVLLGLRRMTALCYDFAPWPSGRLFPRSAKRIGEQVVTLPAGERLLLIAITAVFFGPRVTFLALLAWGALATGYVLAGQLARSKGLSGQRLSGQRRLPGGGGLAGLAGLAGYRGDGVLSRWFGGPAQGRLPPLPPVLVGLFVTCVLVALGLGNLPGILLLAPVLMMMLATLGARHPHDGSVDWLVPPLLQTGEYVFLVALGFATRVPAALIFALIAGVILRHHDLAYRARFGMGISADVRGLGWEGRMLLAALAAIAGLATFAYAVISGYLWLLFAWDFLSGWLKVTDGDSFDRDGPRRGSGTAAAA